MNRFGYRPSTPRYRDREDAGEELAERLSPYIKEDFVILAVPNGGVPVGIVLARRFGLSLYLMLVRKLQIPDNPEAGFGALTYDGFLLLNHQLLEKLRLSDSDIENQKEKALSSIRTRQNYFGKWADPPPLHDRSVVLTDDGLASGFTMEAAVRSVEHQGANRIVIAVPTSSQSAYTRLKPNVDKIICPNVSHHAVFAVADAYENWYDLEDSEVLSYLENLS